MATLKVESKVQPQHITDVYNKNCLIDEFPIKFKKYEAYLNGEQEDINSFIELCDLLNEWFFMNKLEELKEYRDLFNKYLLKFVQVMENDQYKEFIIALGVIGIDDQAIIILGNIRDKTSDITKCMNIRGCECDICLL